MSVQEDARRYRRLRLLGCAPAETSQLEQRTVMRFQTLDAFLDEDLKVHPTRGEADGASVHEDEHERNATAFVEKVRHVLIDGLRVSPESHPPVFEALNDLRRELRFLLCDHADLAVKNDRKQIQENLQKLIETTRW